MDPEDDEIFQIVEFDITPRPDGSEPTLAIISVERTPDPRARDSDSLRDVEETYMQVIADITGARATHTGQGTTASNGNPWDFELAYENGKIGLGEHVLYTDPSTQEAPERAAFRVRHATDWDPDGDFRAILTSPAVAKHVRRVSAWHSNPNVSLDESHLVVETHSIVPAVEIMDVWEEHYGRPLKPVRSTLTKNEIGDVTFIWVMSQRTPNILLLARHTWLALPFKEVDSGSL